MSAFSGRGCAVLLACLGVALIFGVVAPAAAGPTPSFAGPKHYATGRGPLSVAIGDLTGDHRPDLALANYGSGTVSVLINRGGGTFQRKLSYPTGKGPGSVAIGDVNGDGRPDLVTANYDVDTVSVLINRGKGSFRARVDYETGSGPFEVAIGDLNGDHKPDLATANADGNAVSVLLNNGDGTFEAKLTYRTGRDPRSVAIGDVNGDGKPDLVTANYGADTVSVLTNRGDGSFQPKLDYRTGSGPRSVAIGDLNGDGKLDLATANTNVDVYSVSVLANRGDGSFRPKRDYATGRGPLSIAIGDLTGDHKPDLALANYYEALNVFTGSVSVLANRGDGRFRSGPYYRAGRGPDSVAIGDLNGDRKPDLVTANADGNAVSVLLNATGLCAVPSVIGAMLAAAKRAIGRAHCRVGAIGAAYSRTVRSGRVISERPKPGTVLPTRGKVNLVVSRGRKH
jgi:hypothetical protein